MSNLVIAQDAPTIQFGQISSEDGLSHSSVNCITQDSFGFIWIGTMDGLNRYDGRRVEIFKHNDSDSTSLPDNTVWSVFTSDNGDIWIGTSSGLCLYSYQTGKFHRVLLENGAEKNNPIRQIIQDQAGSIFAKSSVKGLYKIEKEQDKDSYQVTNYIDDPEYDRLIRNDYYVVFNLDPYRKNTIWLASKDKLYTINTITNHLKNWPLQTKSSNITISSITIDERGMVWIGTQTDGLLRFHPETNHTEFYRPNSNDKNSIGFADIFSISEDRNRELWISSLSGGLSHVVDWDKGIFYNYTVNGTDPFSLSTNSLNKIYEDKNGNIWVGTQGAGVQYFSTTRSKFSLQRSDNKGLSFVSNNIASVYEDKDGYSWVSTRGTGLSKIKWDKTGNYITELSQYEHQSGNPQTINENTVLSYYDDKYYGLLVGTRLGGLNVYDREDDVFRDYMDSPGDLDALRNSQVIDISGTKDNRVWLATSAGVFLWDRERKQLIDFNATDDQLQRISNYYVTFVYEDQGVLWVGTNSNGLFAWDMRQKELQWYHDQSSQEEGERLKNNLLLSFHDDQKGHYWIGSWQGGLYKFDYKNRIFNHYGIEHGLNNSVVYSILEDGDGHLWMSTNKGISRFNPTTETFNNFSIRDGLQGEEYNSRVGFKSPSSGRMYFGGMNGLNLFDPSSIPIDTLVPDLYITELTQYIRSDNQIISTELVEMSTLSELTIPYDCYLIDVKIAAPMLPRSDELIYAYMIEGLSNQWINLGSRQEFSLTSLPPGKFKLKLKVGFEYGVWNPKEVSIDIISLPPWWRTWWAYLVYTIMVIIIFYLIYHNRVSQLLKYQNLRTKISSDLHDDVGTILSTIAFQAEIMEIENKQEQKAELTKLSRLSRKAMSRMRDTVWAKDARRDNVESLVARMNDFLVDAFEHQNLRYNFQKIISKDTNKIAPDHRQAIYLIFKESVTNALKHSNVMRLISI